MKKPGIKGHFKSDHDSINKEKGAEGEPGVTVVVNKNRALGVEEKSEAIVKLDAIIEADIRDGASRKTFTHLSQNI